MNYFVPSFQLPGHCDMTIKIVLKPLLNPNVSSLLYSPWSMYLSVCSLVIQPGLTQIETDWGLGVNAHYPN